VSEEVFSEADVARYWDANADLWAREVRRGRDIARERLNNPAFLAFIGDLRGKRVLDAGCGEGYNSRILARGGARVSGIDLSERMIALATAEESRQPLGIRYARASYADLSIFEDGSFDAVVSFMALMDGPHLDAAMREALRVLRPGGMLAFSLTHPCFLTQGSEWVRDEKGDTTGWTVRGYFDSAPCVDSWRFVDAPLEIPKFELPRYDRTLAEYVNSLIAAGFLLTRLAEPRPSEEYCLAHPSQRGWRDHAALFLHVRAEKPAQ
jgi:2-polyprenyl-3-methyl-5-hydroxy-6-metoxy-1,4-benzoquinol methylase